MLAPGHTETDGATDIHRTAAVPLALIHRVTTALLLRAASAGQ